MEKSKPDIPNLLNLGSVFGQSQAFGIVAGRCSAAQAACLHRLRRTNEFQLVTPRWREFCSHHLGIDGRNADKIVRLWEEFGAAYFELAQLTPIPPDTYRALAPSIREGALHLNGEAIELIPENSRRLATAIAAFRRAAPSPPVSFSRTNSSPLSTNVASPSSPTFRNSPTRNAAARTGSSSLPSSSVCPQPSTASNAKTACASQAASLPRREFRHRPPPASAPVKIPCG